MTDHTTGPTYDPARPRPLRREQAEDASFYSLLGRLTIGRIQAIFDDARRVRVQRRAEFEAISHDEALARLGYKPDEALIRTRRALPPDLPKPVEQKRKWWQR